MSPDRPEGPTPLELEILVALGEKPRHGYGIIQDIESRSNAFGNLRSGTLYLALRRLKSAGLVESCPTPPDEQGGDARRKFMRLTKTGRYVARRGLEAMRLTLDAGVARQLLDPEVGR